MRSVDDVTVPAREQVNDWSAKHRTREFTYLKYRLLAQPRIRSIAVCTTSSEVPPYNRHDQCCPDMRSSYLKLDSTLKAAKATELDESIDTSGDPGLCDAEAYNHRAERAEGVASRSRKRKTD